MLLRRILYCGALVGVFVFQITNDNYLAHFLLALTISLPLLSLALSFLGMVSCRLTLAAVPPELPRGGAGTWNLLAESSVALPVARITLQLKERNLFTGRETRRKLTLSGVSRRRPVTRSAGTDHCGLLELTVDKIRVLDYLGLFTLSRPAPLPARLLVSPVPVEPPPLNLPEGMGVRPSPNSTLHKGPGEDYDLRDYRPGDPMRSVHWKLSSKWDELIVRERAQTTTPLPLFTFDRFGAPGELDRVLDKLLGISLSLLAVQRPHAVLWLDGAGESVLRLISDEKELQDCLLAILSTPLPPAGSAIADHPELIRMAGESVFRHHITAGKGDGHG